MTKQEKKEIERVCGPNFKYNDIPSYIRRRDEITEAMSRDSAEEEAIQRERQRTAEEREEIARMEGEEIIV